MKHSTKPTALLVNPPVYDFAAYDLWAKPLGLLYIAALLRKAGVEVSLLDYMDRRYPELPEQKSNAYGCGKYFAQEAPKPDTLKQIPRNYHRFGIPKALARKAMEAMEKPSVVLVGSGMTYWYPGVREAIATVKECFPSVPVLLGGVYATLCYEHARQCSGADHVVTGGDISQLAPLFEACGISLSAGALPKHFNDFPAPDFSFYQGLPYAVLSTSRGCPFHCSYCASDRLSAGVWEKKKWETVVQEIELLVKGGAGHIAFYDDALFMDADRHIMPILAGILSKKLSVNLHSPNGLHARYINGDLAALLKRSGFRMPRLSLETSDEKRQVSTGGKVSGIQFESAVGHLRAAGYRPGEYGAYLLMGMPGQEPDEVEASVRWAHGQGAKVYLSEYSPIPGTADWETVKHQMPSQDPLWHNNSLLPLVPLETWQTYQKLKDLARTLNRKFDND